MELGSRRIEAEENLLAGFVAGFLNRSKDEVECLGVRFQIGSEAAFIANGRRQFFVVERFLQRVKGFRAGAQCVGERIESGGDDHELLHVEVVVSVSAAVNDIHLRHRQRSCARTAEVFEEREAGGFGGRPRHCQRNAEDRVRTELRLVVGAVELIHHQIDHRLLARIHAFDLLRDRVIDVVDRFEDALAAEAALVAVAQLERFVLARRRARGHGGAAGHARGELDVDFDGGVAAGIEDLAGADGDNLGHEQAPERRGVQTVIRSGRRVKRGPGRAASDGKETRKIPAI